MDIESEQKHDLSRTLERCKLESTRKQGDALTALPAEKRSATSRRSSAAASIGSSTAGRLAAEGPEGG
ncbi:hypothetical protein RAA17_22460 [Komagataeibacter rhaeticus]|nr:hypothetical protein [Komagataeibacter rhaeticus]